jgi:hypothetical protein
MFYLLPMVAICAIFCHRPLLLYLVLRIITQLPDSSKHVWALRHVYIYNYNWKAHNLHLQFAKGDNNYLVSLRQVEIDRGLIVALTIYKLLHTGSIRSIFCARSCSSDRSGWIRQLASICTVCTLCIWRYRCWHWWTCSNVMNAWPRGVRFALFYRHQWAVNDVMQSREQLVNCKIILHVYRDFLLTILNIAINYFVLLSNLFCLITETYVNGCVVTAALIFNRLLSYTQGIQVK